MANLSNCEVNGDGVSVERTVPMFRIAVPALFNRPASRTRTRALEATTKRDELVELYKSDLRDMVKRKKAG